MTDMAPALDPDRTLGLGADIDADLGISDRGRRKTVADGGCRHRPDTSAAAPYWRVAEYLAARERLLNLGKPRRPGVSVAARDSRVSDRRRAER